MTPIVQESIINGKTYKFEVHLADSFKYLQDNKSVNGFGIDKNGQVLLIKGEKKPWSPPGGAIEQGESLEQALIREMYEEAAVHIDPKSIKPLFYQKTYIDLNNDSNFVFVGNKLRYACKILSAETFVADPDNGDITEQMYCNIEDLHKYVNWGAAIELTEELLKKLIQA